jgi:hypothetical protein
MPRLIPVAVSVLVITGLLGLSSNFRWPSSPEGTPYGGDFLHEWTGGYIVRAGDRDRLYDGGYAIALEHDPNVIGFALRPDAYLPMVYPPFYYVLVSPLSALSFRAAALLWLGLSLVWFAASAALLGRALHPAGTLGGIVRDIEARMAAAGAVLGRWMLPIAVAFAPFVENLRSSQKGTLSLLILSATFLLLQRGRSLTAGLVFGLQAFKPQLAVVIGLAMLAKRQWRFAFGAGLTVAVLVGLSLAVGARPCLDYLRFTREVGDYIRAQPTYLHRSHCLYAFFTLLAHESSTSVRLVTLLAGASTVWLLARLLRGPLVPAAPVFLAQFSGLVLATVLLSPHFLTYDLTILLLPMLLLALLLLNGAGRPIERRALCWLLVALYVAAGVSPLIARQAGVQVSTLIIFGLLALLASLRERHWPVGG